MRKNFIPMYEVGMNIVTEGEKTTPIYEVWKGIVTEGYVRSTKKRACGNRLVGIKNSWKYEKDLIIILNGISVIFTIAQVGNIQKPIG